MNSYPPICDFIFEQRALNSDKVDTAYYKCSSYLEEPPSWEDVALVGIVVIPLVIAVCFIGWLISKN